MSSLARIRAGRWFLLLAAAALAFEADPRIPWLAGVGAASCFVAAAVVRTVQAEVGLRRARRAADRVILAHRHVTWRELELTDGRALVALVGEIDRLLHTLASDRLPSSSPLNRPALRQHEELLRRVVLRLEDRRPVSARGVLFLQQLLRDGASPLYSDQAGLLLPRAVSRVLLELDR